MDKYYKVLGLAPGASQEEIKKQYRSLAHKFHPDHEGGDEEKFKEINEAYQILSGKAQPSHQNQQPPSGFGFDPFEIFKNAQGFPGNPFGAGSMHQQQRRPPSDDCNIALELELTVDDIKNGREFNIKYNKSRGCTKCGEIGGKEKNKCNTCEGNGMVIKTQQQGNNFYHTYYPCPQCKGCGNVIVDPCSDCSGNGYIVETQYLKFEVKERK